jgi:tetratricopeptide (TPR) repeat protein
MQYKVLILLFLVFTIPGPKVLKAAEGNDAGNHASEASSQSLSIPAEIQKLINEAKHQYYELGDLNFADSLATLAVRSAERTFQPDLILHVLNQYLGMNELGYDRDKALEFAVKAEGLATKTERPELAWETYTNLATVYLDHYDFDKATAFSYKALTIAESEDDEILRATSYITIGNTLQQNNQNLEAFRYYLNALTIAESTKEKSILRTCYRTLSRFHSLNKGYEKAVSFKMKEIDLINSSQPIDSMTLIWALSDLEEISINYNNEVHEDKIREIIDYAERHHNTYLKQYILALFRTFLMNNSRFERLHQLYYVDYPEELLYISENQPSVFYRLKAIFFEIENNVDSALHYYLRAESLIVKNQNKVMQSNFYIRFGEFLQRQGKNREAVGQFERGFLLAQEASYFDFSLKAGKVLVALYKEMGNYERALFFSEMNRAISDSIIQLNRKDEMLNLELQNAAHLRELEQEATLGATQRRNNIQYSFIVLMISLSFVILILLGSFKVSARMIHFLGFLSFIFLFEFIILLADNYIHHATHGEPLKILAIKIVLIAFLLPLHHWIEKKVTHSLIHRRLIRIERGSWRTALLKVRHTAREIWAKWD